MLAIGLHLSDHIKRGWILQILESPQRGELLVPEMTKDIIAYPTKKAPNETSSVIMIDRKLPGLSCRSLADVALAALRLVERLVLLSSESISLLDPLGVCGLLEGPLALSVARGTAGTGRLKRPCRTPAILTAQ